MRSILFGVVVLISAIVIPSLSADPKEKSSDTKVATLLKRFVNEFVEIVPGGSSKDGSMKFPATFRMGSDRAPAETPVHEVTLKKPFAIAKYEVPQILYEAVMGVNPSEWKGPRNSAEKFSWPEANLFCGKITSLLRDEKLMSDDEEVRLPTEAEWEYCCRAGTETVYSFGDEPTKPGDKDKQASRLNEFGWHTGNAAGNDPPVGALKANPWGLYDMHGYLWEFVEDSWHNDYANAPIDGRARTEANPTKLVVRGGSWKDHFSKLTSTTRRAVKVDEVDSAIGFRCVRAKRR